MIEQLKSHNWKDISRRALKTFLQASAALLVVDAAILPAVIIGVITALISTAVNILGFSPTSLPGRAGSTFLQTFAATWAVTGYELTAGVIVASLAASISAVMNFIKEKI